MPKMNPGLGLAKRAAAKWDRMERLVFARAGGKCEDCGAEEVLTPMHSGVWTNISDAFAPEDMLALCAGCKAERRRGWDDPEPGVIGISQGGRAPGPPGTRTRD